MQYTLLVLSPPDSGASARHALGFAQALCSAGHQLACVFFFDAGALTALAHCEATQDELDIRAGWQALAQEHDTRLIACVASTARFGPGDDATSDSVLSGFTIAGLGELIESAGNSQRFLTFADQR